jgi:hypothetical protein
VRTDLVFAKERIMPLLMGGISQKEILSRLPEAGNYNKSHALFNCDEQVKQTLPAKRREKFTAA